MTSTWILWFKQSIIRFGSEWKIPTIESLVFKVLDTFQNCKFVKDCTKIPLFIYYTNSKVNRRHLYEWCEKNYFAKLSWDEEEMDDQNWPFNVTLHKTIQNSSIFRQKKLTHVWDCSQPCCVLHTLYELTRLTCSLVTWAKSKIWRWSSKWDIGSVKKMLWHVPYTTGVLDFCLLHCR
jgi:hypothetical protein